MEAYELNGTLYLKCPVAKYTYCHSWFGVCVTPAAWGYTYSRFAEYCSPEEFVWICHSPQDWQAWRFPDQSESDPQKQNLDEMLKQARKIPVKSIKHPEFGYHYGGFSRIELPRPCVPCIRNESENGFWWTALAVLDGILIDLPVSLVMTLTGSIWYIPLTEL